MKKADDWIERLAKFGDKIDKFNKDFEEADSSTKKKMFLNGAEKTFSKIEKAANKIEKKRRKLHFVNRVGQKLDEAAHFLSGNDVDDDIEVGNYYFNSHNNTRGEFYSSTIFLIKKGWFNTYKVLNNDNLQYKIKKSGSSYTIYDHSGNTISSLSPGGFFKKVKINGEKRPTFTCTNIDFSKIYLPPAIRNTCCSDDDLWKAEGNIVTDNWKIYYDGGVIAISTQKDESTFELNVHSIKKCLEILAIWTAEFAFTFYPIE